MTINQLYDTWYEGMSELRPDEHTCHLRSFVWLVVGLFLAQSVHLGKIAKKIPGSATNKSKERRVLRLLDNPVIRVRRWYAPWITAIFDSIVAHDPPVRLIVDGSKVGFGHQLLLVAVAYRRRAIPVAWTWVKGSRGHSSSWKQLALLSYVRSLIPAEATVSLVGDSEFGAIPVLKWLDKTGWYYVLRQKGNHLVQLPHATQWRRFDSLISRRRRRVWIPHAHLTAKHAYSVNLIADWKPGEKEPWLLATNYLELRAALRAYRKRMWIKEMFAISKDMALIWKAPICATSCGFRALRWQWFCCTFGWSPMDPKSSRMAYVTSLTAKTGVI